jgi:hypothetical protein
MAAGLTSSPMEMSALPLGHDDNKRLLILVGGLSHKCVKQIRMKGFALARELLEAHEIKVQTVAAHLIKHGQLNGGDFATIMRGP